MRRKVLYLFSLFVFLFSVTGCVKYNGTMEIKKDKSMNISINYGLDTSFFGTDQLVSDEDKAKYSELGYTVTDYTEGNYKGVTLTKNIKNIDSVSDESDVDYSLSDESSNNSYIFKVKKGFLKNTYVAKFTFDTSDSDLSTTDDFGDDDYIIDDNDLDVSEFDNDLDISEFDNDLDISEFNNDLDVSEFDSDLDISAAMTSMDLSFNVKLPYSAISSNASSMSNDNKDLVWDLVATGSNSIEFEFSLYNIFNIVLVGGGALLLIIIVLVIAISSSKKKKRKNNSDVDTTSAIPELSDINNNVQPFSEQSFNKQLMSQNQGVSNIVSNQPAQVDAGISNVSESSQIDIVEPILDIDDNNSLSNISNSSVIEPQTIVQPQNVQPQNVQPQNVQPQNVQPQNVQPQNVQPQNVQPQNVQPQNVQSQNVQPQNVQPQNVISQNGVNVGSQNMNQPNVDLNSNGVQNSNISMIPNDAFNNVFGQPVVDSNSSNNQNNG